MGAASEHEASNSAMGRQQAAAALGCICKVITSVDEPHQTRSG
jgi:hypothetical protein